MLHVLKIAGLVAGCWCVISLLVAVVIGRVLRGDETIDNRGFEWDARWDNRLQPSPVAVSAVGGAVGVSVPAVS